MQVPIDKLILEKATRCCGDQQQGRYELIRWKPDETAATLFGGWSRSVKTNYQTLGDEYRDWKRDIQLVRDLMQNWLESEGVIESTAPDELHELEKAQAEPAAKIEKLKK